MQLHNKGKQHKQHFYTANLFAIPAQFEIFGKRDLFSRSVKKMQLFEAYAEFCIFSGD